MGEFTPEQWQGLKDSFRLDWAPAACDAQCENAAKLGQALFFEPKLSGTGTVACVTCHAVSTGAGKPAWLSDLRAENAVSASATGYTRHNTISLVNVALKEDLAPSDQHWFTWTGQCSSGPCMTPGIVITDIALPRAMASTPAIIGDLIRGDRFYAELYGAAYQESDDATILANVVRAFEAYMRRLVSVDSPFDRFVQGDDAALDDSAKRGFALFVGRALCIECHRGPLMTDYGFHVTGVEQRGLHAPLTDDGRDHTGAFFTATLRQTAETGPYMHDGSLQTLADVVDFYRWGGAAAGYIGEKDPRIVPLEIDDDDARDLETFLRTLTGSPVADALRVDTRCMGGACP